MPNNLKIDFTCGYDYSIVMISFKNSILSTDIVSFLSFYHFTKFKRGKYFLKRLINRIITKQLNQKMLWKRNFWDKIKVEKREISIEYCNTDTNNIILDFLNSNQSSRRMKNIVHYTSLIKDNIDLGFPIYTTGACLNILGPKILNSEDLFIVDGSRRLWSYILNRKKKMYVWLITLK